MVENWTIELCALWSRFSLSGEWATNATEAQSLSFFRDRQEGAKLPDLSRRGKPNDTADYPITQVPTVQDPDFTPMRGQPRPHSPHSSTPSGAARVLILGPGRGCVVRLQMEEP